MEIYSKCFQSDNLWSPYVVKINIQFFILLSLKFFVGVYEGYITYWAFHIPLVIAEKLIFNGLNSPLQHICLKIDAERVFEMPFYLKFFYF